jgi:hypothetical protein
MWLGMLVGAAACRTPHSALEVSSPQLFDHIELFFVDAAYPSVTDPKQVPHSTPNVPGHTTAADAELWIRKFDPADVWTSDVAVTSASFGIPEHVGVGPYLAIVASSNNVPVAFTEILDYRDGESDTYKLVLDPIVLASSPALLRQPPLQLPAPCNGPATDTCLHGTFTPGTLSGVFPSPVDVTVHVRGVMESVVYHGGLAGPGGWYSGTAVSTPSSATTFSLIVDSSTMGSTTYFLNAGNTDGLVQVFDYDASFVAPKDAFIRYGAGSNNSTEQANEAQFQAGTSLDTTTGQYAVVKFVAAHPVTNNVMPSWPNGAEIWSRPATAPSCLRLTTKTGTHFVATLGDTDCDALDDTKDDCDATSYCDPANDLGCTTLCDEKFPHQSGQLRLSTCSNSQGARGVDACAGHVGPPSYCIADDSACPPATPLDPHSTLLDCVMRHHPDVVCTLATSSAGLLCQPNFQLSLSGLTNCTNLALLDRTSSLLSASAAGGACNVDFVFASSDPATAPIYALLGNPAAGGGYDTISVKINFAMNTCGTQPSCVPQADDAPHDCR